MKIALDAMGGDYAPQKIVEGAVLAARDYNIEAILVGDQNTIKRELSKHNTKGLSLSIYHASQKIEMQDSPSVAIRKKRDSSIYVATTLVKRKEAAAVISAGHTGAMMATALFVLGSLKGVERPAIATVLPTITGTSVMLDVGANVDCKPQHLFQFSIMGEVYAERVLGIRRPRIGLLSIGEEDIKGNLLTKETFRILKTSQLNFIGNVEGRDVYMGNADVIVCDGFIGNVALKISEGLADAIIKLLKKEIAAATFGKIGYSILKPAFTRFKKRIDYSEYGGAPLLGVNGVCVICHGRSSAKAIKNALKVAKDFSESKVNEYIQKDIEKNMAYYTSQRRGEAF